MASDSSSKESLSHIVFLVAVILVIGVLVGAVVSGGGDSEGMDKQVAFKTIKLLHAEVQYLKELIGPLPKAELDDSADEPAGGGVDPDLHVAARTIRLLQSEIKRLRVAHASTMSSSLSSSVKGAASEPTTKLSSSVKGAASEATTKYVPPFSPQKQEASSEKTGGAVREGSPRLEEGSLSKEAGKLKANLTAFLAKAMPSPGDFPKKHLEKDIAQDGDQDPASEAGRTLWALATHPGINTIVSYYSGAGVFSLAKGLAHKYATTKVKGKIITSEINHGEWVKMMKLLKAEELTDFVEVRDKGTEASDPALCSEHVDLFVEDMSGAEPLMVMDKVKHTVLTMCQR